MNCCYLDAAEPVRLDFATASRVMVTECQLTGLTGEMLIARELDLSRSTSTSSVHLLVAEISGQLDCRGARVLGCNSEGSALNADRLKAGAVYLSEGFTAPAGAVRLAGADIAGLLNCRGAQLAGTDSDGYALGADGMKAAGAVLDEEFTATGAIRLADAHISGQLSCRGAQLTGCDSYGNALVADCLKADMDVFFSPYKRPQDENQPRTTRFNPRSAGSASLPSVPSPHSATCLDRILPERLPILAHPSASSSIHTRPSAMVTSAARGIRCCECDTTRDRQNRLNALTRRQSWHRRQRLPSVRSTSMILRPA
jgi:hypothetical protein